MRRRLGERKIGLRFGGGGGGRGEEGVGRRRWEWGEGGGSWEDEMGVGGGRHYSTRHLTISLKKMEIFFSQHE